MQMPKIGDTIKIICMKDEPHYNGKSGTVEHIDSLGQIHGKWGGCAIIPEIDQFLIQNEEKTNKNQ